MPISVPTSFRSVRPLRLGVTSFSPANPKDSPVFEFRYGLFRSHLPASEWQAQSLCRRLSVPSVSLWFPSSRTPSKRFDKARTAEKSQRTSVTSVSSCSNPVVRPTAIEQPTRDASVHQALGCASRLNFSSFLHSSFRAAFLIPSAARRAGTHAAPGGISSFPELPKNRSRQPLFPPFSTHYALMRIFLTAATLPPAARRRRFRLPRNHLRSHSRGVFKFHDQTFLRRKITTSSYARMGSARLGDYALICA